MREKGLEQKLGKGFLKSLSDFLPCGFALNYYRNHKTSSFMKKGAIVGAVGSELIRDFTTFVIYDVINHSSSGDWTIPHGEEVAYGFLGLWYVATTLIVRKVAHPKSIAYYYNLLHSGKNN